MIRAGGYAFGMVDINYSFELKTRADVISFIRALGQHFSIEAVQNVFNDYLSRIQMTDQIQLSIEETNNLSNKLVATYTLWNKGHELRNMISKATYYRQRKALMEYGINCKASTTNVVPMFRILEAKAATIPQWAFSNNLIHPSARSA